MKVICDFCKTEYNIDNKVSGPVKCAVCGHTWVVRRPANKNVWLMFFAALCALLSAIVFAGAVVLHHRASNIQTQPLLPSVTGIHYTADETGTAHLVVEGTIVNQSDDIYGVPNLLIMTHDSDGRVLGRQKFMAPATLLDAGASVSFSYTLSGGTEDVQNVTIEFQNMGEK